MRTPYVGKNGKNCKLSKLLVNMARKMKKINDTKVRDWYIEGLKCAKMRWDINTAIENKHKMSFLEVREIGRKWEKEVMIEEEDDEEELDI